MRNRNAIIAPSAEDSSPLKIIYRDVNELIPQDKNVRQHPKKQIAQIARSISAFGFNVPFQIDRNSRLIAGHGRLEACQMLGIRRVPTICLEHLSEAQIRAFAIAENKIAEGGRWDRSSLAEELHFLSGIDLDFDLKAIGFNVKEIELLVDGVNPAPRKKTNTVEQPSARQSEIPVSSLGDVWALGNHRLICGSAWDPQTYSVLMKGRLATAAFTYVAGNNTENTESLVKLFTVLYEYSDANPYQFVISDEVPITSLLVAADHAGLRLADLCVAIKEAVGPGRLYKNERDLVFVFEKRDAQRSHKREFQRTNVWRCPRSHLRRCTAEPLDINLIHNELQPALVADSIRDSTAVGDIVLVPFLGQATTLIAAEQTGRICYAIEPDPLAMDKTVQLWQRLTGETAKHVNQDTPFDQIAEVRNVKG
jgi:ParB/Sulfiredoxin domain/DNA methylase